MVTCCKYHPDKRVLLQVTSYFGLRIWLFKAKVTQHLHNGFIPNESQPYKPGLECGREFYCLRPPKRYSKFFYDSQSHEEAVQLKTLVANLGIQRQSFLRWISTYLTWYSLSALALFDLLSFLN